jgi:predicted dinucleotide-binding enzyme
VVILAIPKKKIPHLPHGILDDLRAGAPVIDTGIYVPQQRDGSISEIEAGLPESQWVEAQLGHPVIKAFNTIRAQSLFTGGRPGGLTGGRGEPLKRH